MLTRREVGVLVVFGFLVYWVRLAYDPRVAPLAGDPEPTALATRVVIGFGVVFGAVLVLYVAGKFVYTQRVPEPDPD